MATNIGTLRDKDGNIFLPRTDASLVTGLSAVARNGSYNNLTNRPDLSQFITNSINNLTNYYLKSETYTKAEVQALIGAANGFYYRAVDSLPVPSESTVGMIYLVPSERPEFQNTREEYITLERNGSYVWELIGNTAVDLSDYVTTEALNQALAEKQASLVSGTNIKKLAGQDVLGSGDVVKTFTFNNVAVPADLSEGHGAYVKDLYIEFSGTFSNITALITIPSNNFMAIVEANELSAQVINFGGVNEAFSYEVFDPQYFCTEFRVNPMGQSEWSGIVNVFLLSGDFNGDIYAGFFLHEGQLGLTRERVLQPIRNVYSIPSTGIPVSDLQAGIIPTIKTFAGEQLTGTGDLVNTYDVTTSVLSFPNGAYSAIVYGGAGYAIVSSLNGEIIYDFGLVQSAERTNDGDITLKFNTGVTTVYTMHLAGTYNVPSLLPLADFAELDNEVSIIRYFESMDIDLTPTLNSSNLVTSNGVYSKIHGLGITYNPSTSLLSLKSGNTVLSTVDVSDFSVSGLLTSASFSNDVLTLNFSSGDTVNVNLTNILSEIISDYTDEVQSLHELHTVLSETQYDLLAEKDPDVFYYIYED